MSAMATSGQELASAKAQVRWSEKTVAMEIEEPGLASAPGKKRGPSLRITTVTKTRWQALVATKKHPRSFVGIDANGTSWQALEFAQIRRHTFLRTTAMKTEPLALE